MCAVRLYFLALQAEALAKVGIRWFFFFKKKERRKCYLYHTIMTFKKSEITLSESGQFSQLIIDYINSAPALKSFYAYEPTIESFSQAIIDCEKQNVDREQLVKALHKQYKQSSISEMETSINRLADKNTFTVCTGHQLCVFTGPLYFIYKLISTINLAKALKKKYPTNDFIPVFWMASEDHDFEEIASIHLFGKTITWDNATAAGAVGRLQTKSLEKQLEELTAILGASEPANKLIHLFQEAYLSHANLADATRWLVHKLFSSDGLLIIDGDDAALKATFSAILKDDLLNHSNYTLINQTITELEKLDIKPQVNPRLINCFYVKENIRERIEQEPDGLFRVLNTPIVFTKEALLEELQNHPERFSPNVVLRPVYQQFILPNLAYIGGPGELAYWLEYKAMFDHHHVLFPVLIPRNFAVLLDDKIEQQFTKAGFTISDIFKKTQVLINELVTKNTTAELSLETQQADLASVFESISVLAAAVDSTLKPAVDAEFQKVTNALKNIESKMLRSEKHKQETGINQLKKMKEKLFPEDALHERYDSFIPYYLKYGDHFIEHLKEAFDPFDNRLLILKLD